MRPEVLSEIGTGAAAIQIAAGLLFMSAGTRKVMHWREFRGVLGAYRLLPASAVALAAVAIVVLELLFGAAAILGWGMPLTTLVIAAMLVLFAAAMAINISRGRTSIDCGCFQSALRQQLEWRLVIRNLVCALLVAGASVPVVADPMSRLRALPAGVALFCLYLALQAVWALDVSKRAVLSRS